MHNDTTELPDTTSYSIRTNFTQMFSNIALRDLFWRPDPENSGHYITELKWGIIFLQDLIERALIRRKTNSSLNMPGGYVQPFPFHCYTFDINLLIGQVIFPIFILIGNIFTITLLARVVVQEREKRLTDMMSVFGVGVVENWASWVCTYYIMLIPTVILTVVLLKTTQVLPHSNPYVILLALLSNNISLMTLALLTCIPFKRATLAATSVGMVYILLYFLVPLFQFAGFDTPKWMIVLSQFFTPTTLGTFFVETIQYELKGEGIQWSNLVKSPFEVGFSIPLLSLVFLLINTIVYFLLAVYLYEVVVGVYGKRKPFYFIFLPSYWTGKENTSKCVTKKLQNSAEDEIVLLEASAENKNVNWEPLAEENETNNQSAVMIDKVSKYYWSGIFYKKKKLQALKSISLNLHEGQVTVLLGHNGAGKTTLMMILSGIFQQTKGHITIYGHSLEEERKRLQLDTIGLCPQHNILFPNFSVMEHFYFYGSLRGMSVREIKKESSYLLATMRLTEDKNKRTGALSGGMARKLSVCLAFLGSPRLVILDEPTAGVDPSSRAEIWDFLATEKARRCILLSTHHMDEAEVLGDRIAMIDHGHLLCVGTLQYLKSFFNLRYSLVLEKKADFTEMEEAELKMLMESNLEDCSSTTVGKKDIKYSISIDSLEAEHSPVTSIMEELENNKDKFGISSYGLTAPSLEQLFLMLTELHHKEHVKETSINEMENVTFKNNNHNINKVHFFTLICLQTYALFIKRIHDARRNIKGLLLRYGLFSSILIFTMVLEFITTSKTPNSSRFYPGIYLSLNSPQYAFIGASDGASNEYEYLDTMVCPGGYGVPPFIGNVTEAENVCPTIDNGQNSNVHCSLDRERSCWSYEKQTNHSHRPNNCRCESQMIECDERPSKPPEMLAVGDGTIIQELIGYNITEYLIATYHEYIMKRYVGTSFGYSRNDIPIVNKTKEKVLKELDDDSLKNFMPSAEQLAVRNFSKAWFTFKGYHAMKISLNLMNNAILRKEMRDRGCHNNFTEYGIIGNAELWELTPSQRAFTELTTAMPIVIPIFLFLAFCFLVVHPIIFVLEEKSAGTKSLQDLFGLGQTIYFIVNFISELTLYTFAVVLSLIILKSFNYTPLVSLEHISPFIITVMGYGCLNICLMQLLAKICTSGSLSYVVIAVLMYVTGMSTLIVIFSLEFEDSIGGLNLKAQLETYFCILPQFSFAIIIYRLIIDNFFNLAQAEVGNTLGIGKKDPFEYYPVGKSILIIYTEFILFFLINVAIAICYDLNVRIVREANTRVNLPIIFTEDSDIEEERTRVMSNPHNPENAISLNRISKRYYSYRDLLSTLCPFNFIKRKSNRYSVEDVTFSVKNECFGLLGLNGAGKTTIFKSITGVHSVTKGRIEFRGEDIASARKKVHKNLGYTPQKDALFDFLTGKEHLQYYGRLKGLSGALLKQSIDSIIAKVQLSEHQNVITSKYSGGNKRKLSTAIALISTPTLLLLDEPTSGE